MYLDSFRLKPEDSWGLLGGLNSLDLKGYLIRKL